ncbi:hypothetical protein SNEBB_005559 [Seison nebaliae]|nr:hypothetical protein SNEBB_005559 [Seison nebaliae]
MNTKKEQDDCSMTIDEMTEDLPIIDSDIPINETQSETIENNSGEHIDINVPDMVEPSREMENGNEVGIENVNRSTNRNEREICDQLLSEESKCKPMDCEENVILSQSEDTSMDNGCTSTSGCDDSVSVLKVDSGKNKKQFLSPNQPEMAPKAKRMRIIETSDSGLMSSSTPTEDDDDTEDEARERPEQSGTPFSWSNDIFHPKTFEIVKGILSNYGVIPANCCFSSSMENVSNLINEINRDNASTSNGRGYGAGNGNTRRTPLYQLNGTLAERTASRYIRGLRGYFSNPPVHRNIRRIGENGHATNRVNERDGNSVNRPIRPHTTDEELVRNIVSNQNEISNMLRTERNTRGEESIYARVRRVERPYPFSFFFPSQNRRPVVGQRPTGLIPTNSAALFREIRNESLSQTMRNNEPERSNSSIRSQLETEYDTSERLRNRLANVLEANRQRNVNQQQNTNQTRPIIDRSRSTPNSRYYRSIYGLDANGRRHLFSCALNRPSSDDIRDNIINSINFSSRPQNIPNYETHTTSSSSILSSSSTTSSSSSSRNTNRYVSLATSGGPTDTFNDFYCNNNPRLEGPWFDLNNFSSSDDTDDESSDSKTRKQKHHYKQLDV